MSARAIQLCLPWRSEAQLRSAQRKARRTPRSWQFNTRWPPRRGDAVYFVTGEGVQRGIFRERRQGLVWLDYIMADGRIIPEHWLLMCPMLTPWRDPATVTEEERKRSVERARTRGEAGADPRRDPELWAHLLQYGMYILLQLEREGKVEPLESVPALPRVN